MFKLPDFPSVDFSKLDLNPLRDVDFSKFVPSVDFSKLDLKPLRDVDFSKFVPSVDAPVINADKLAAAARDAAYLVIGFGALAAERAESVRVSLIENFTEYVASTKTQVESILSAVEPGALLDQARDFGKGAREQVRALLRNAA